MSAVAALAIAAGVADAQEGHFVGDVTCTDIGVQVRCEGKVAGLGKGTTFQINVEAVGTGETTCTNPAGHVAPGQTKTLSVSGSLGPIPSPTSGQFTFKGATALVTTTPTAPPGSCPNDKWIANVTDVTFTTATVTLLENNAAVASQTVTVQ
jgi:hypothetical protein